MKDIKHIGDLIPDAMNPNKGTQRGRGMVEASLRELGAGRSIVVDKDGRVIAGNKTLEAWADIADDGDVLVVKTRGDKLVVVQREDLDLANDPKARKLSVADNRTAEVGLDWDPEVIAAIALEDNGALDGIFSADELAGIVGDLLKEPAEDTQQVARATLAERFIVPPFSVLDARQGYWQERKRAWIALGIKSELGRGDLLTCPSEQVTEPGLNYYRNRACPGGSPRDAASLIDGKTVRGDGRGKAMTREREREYRRAWRCTTVRCSARQGTTGTRPMLWAGFDEGRTQGWWVRRWAFLTDRL